MTILFFARDPGGCNNIIPLIKEAQSQKLSFIVLAKDIAYQKMRHENLDTIDISSILDPKNPDDLSLLLKNNNISFVVTGTSADDMTEKLLWVEAEKRGIPSLAILDQWVNYGIRFSPYGVNEISQYTQNPTHPYLPRWIGVLDQLAFNESVEAGLPESKLQILGWPHIENYIKRSLEISSDTEIENIKNQLRTSPDNFLILFASEPICETYKSTNPDESFWGYTQLSILNSLIEGLVKNKIPTDLWIKLHPKNDIRFFDSIIQDSNHPGINIKLYDKLDEPSLLLKSVDVVVGMSSMILIESYFLKTPIISLQIGLKRKNPFVLSRSGIINTVLSQDDLIKALSRLRKKNYHVDGQISFIENSTTKILNFIQKGTP